MRIKRRTTAIIFFIGAGTTLLIAPLQNYYPIWLLIGVIVMFIESGIDSNWMIEGKIKSWFTRK